MMMHYLQVFRLVSASSINTSQQRMAFALELPSLSSFQWASRGHSAREAQSLPAFHLHFPLLIQQKILDHPLTASARSRSTQDVAPLLSWEAMTASSLQARCQNTRLFCSFFGIPPGRASNR